MLPEISILRSTAIDTSVNSYCEKTAMRMWASYIKLVSGCARKVARVPGMKGIEP